MKKFFRFTFIYLLYLLCFFILFSIAENILLTCICSSFEIIGKRFAVTYVILDCIMLILAYYLSTLAAIKHGIRKRKQLDEKKFMLFIEIFFIAISLFNILINILTYSYDFDVVLNNTDIYIKSLSGKTEVINEIRSLFKTLTIIKCIITSISVLPMIFIVKKKVFLKQKTK